SPNIFALKVFSQSLDIRIEVIPRPFPGCPAPTVCHPKKKCFRQAPRMFDRVHIPTDFHHPLLLLVAMERIIKISQCIRRGQQVVLQNDDFTMLLNDPGDPVDHILRQAPIFLTFHNRNMLEVPGFADNRPYLIYRFDRIRVFRPVRDYISQGAPAPAASLSGTPYPPRMPRSVVYKSSTPTKSPRATPSNQASVK